MSATARELVLTILLCNENKADAIIIMLDELLIAYFISTFIVTLVLGFQQVSNKEERAGLLSSMAIVLMIMQAIVSVAVFGGDPLFPLTAFLLGATILCHHAVIHWNSDFSEQPCACAFFQLKDVSNHETWVVGSVVAGLISVFHV